MNEMNESVCVLRELLAVLLFRNVANKITINNVVCFLVCLFYSYMLLVIMV